MNALNLLRVSWRALMRHKMRSFLTTLGIIIGVGAVIAMVALGYSLWRSARTDTATLPTPVDGSRVVSTAGAK